MTHIHMPTHAHTQTYSGTLLSCKEERNLAVCDDTYELRGIILTEVSQAEKEKYCMISPVCDLTKQKQTCKFREQRGSFQRGGSEWGGCTS